MKYAWLATTLMASEALAQAPSIDTGDTAWLLLCSAMVFLMTPALALFYGGLVSNRNVLNTMMMSFAAVGVVSILWVLVGYTLFFDDGAIIGGLKYLGMNNMEGQVVGTVPAYVYALFQIGFAMIVPALISGSLVERMRFGAFLGFTAVWSLIVYIPLVHWLWSPSGWLMKLGVLDFAGGLPIETACGVSGLVATLVVGGRTGFKSRPVVPHNMPLVLLGVALLWFGWLGFNAGSALTAGHDAARAILTTNTAGAAALLTWLFWEYRVSGHGTALGAATGSIAGLVAITPAAGLISPAAAVLLGMVAASVSFYALTQKHRFRFDDTLDVMAVHGLGGVVGILFVGVFAYATTGKGAPMLEQLQYQLIGLAVTIALSVVGTIASLKIVGLFTALKVKSADEGEGLDLVLHRESGYNNDDFGFILIDEMPNTVLSGD